MGKWKCVCYTDSQSFPSRMVLLSTVVTSVTMELLLLLSLLPCLSLPHSAAMGAFPTSQGNHLQSNLCFRVGFWWGKLSLAVSKCIKKNSTRYDNQILVNYLE